MHGRIMPQYIDTSSHDMNTNTEEVPIALKTMLEFQGFTVSDIMASKLWSDVKKTNDEELKESQSCVQELYENTYKDLDTFPRGMLLDIIVSTVTEYCSWPCNMDSDVYKDTFLHEYISGISKYTEK